MPNGIIIINNPKSILDGMDFTSLSQDLTKGNYGSHIELGEN